MKQLLSFQCARKACAALMAVLTVLENTLAAPVWCILALRSRLSDALENSKRGRGHE